mmetsp:Transcript_28341/g.65833  ORF Transcript_28341/g.65833 Transcript_28341/m.65833 type:complete len:128 (-) Transcript_28341:105-488(-)
MSRVEELRKLKSANKGTDGDDGRGSGGGAGASEDGNSRRWPESGAKGVPQVGGRLPDGGGVWDQFPGATYGEAFIRHRRPPHTFTVPKETSSGRTVKVQSVEKPKGSNGPRLNRPCFCGRPGLGKLT